MRREVDELKAALAALDRSHLRRRRRAIDVSQSASALRNFSSNDYLGLARHTAVIEAMTQATVRYGAGSGASHLVSGHGPEHVALEEEVAAFTGRPRALVFSTGYMANLGTIAALAERRDVVIEDRLNHASLIDAARVSGATLERYSHADSAAAAKLLTDCAGANALVVTDGVFSMDGDIAPLAELAAAARAAKAWLVVDDAHGLGVVGKRGRGSLEHFGLTTDDVPVLIGTFGKAFGTFGAFVAAEAEVIEYLIQKARPYIYTTALPPGVAAATRAALRVAEREPWRREKVHALTIRFRTRAQSLGMPLSASTTPIQPVVVGEAARALEVSAALEHAGFLVTAIRPPTVPAGSARLRVTLSASHSEADVDALVEALHHALRQHVALLQHEAPA
jgi:8-amino-7-oxononanoate synthase